VRKKNTERVFFFNRGQKFNLGGMTTQKKRERREGQGEVRGKGGGEVETLN